MRHWTPSERRGVGWAVVAATIILGIVWSVSAANPDIHGPLDLFPALIMLVIIALIAWGMISRRRPR